ncbi:MAG: M3 family metallopeptidase [Pseudomonadota bacterium]
MTNPLLEPWQAPFDLPPFGKIEDAHFAPAFETALADARAEIERIAENSAQPTFENTIEALELAGAGLGRVLSVFYNLNGADTNPEREALARDFSPRLAAYGSEITMNKALFARIRTLYETRETLDLTQEEARVLYLTHRSFVRSGASLEGAARDRLKEIKGRLAVLGTEFGQNLLADEREWYLQLSEADLEGLPEFVVEAARAAGTEKGLEAPVVTLSRSLIVPFLQFSPRRDLREKAHTAWAARGANGGKTDNREIVGEILHLREERAKLLGYPNFAAFKLETEMAKTPGAVDDLLMKIWKPAKRQADAQEAHLTQLLRSDGINEDLAPWDWRYYAEKRRKAEHDLDEAELKLYLQLDKMIDAAFACAKRLFGLSFEPIERDWYHPDVRAWNVTRDGDHLAVFVGDYFARGSKRSGAWCSAMRQQQKLAGDIRPIVVNVCNFAKPSADAPALLSYDDARTLFHEFGHALHQMLSNVRFESVSGTSVARDFVELPSQLYEHWLEVPEILQEFATHAETGDPMPGDLLDRLRKAQNFDQGFQTVEYIASALVDLDFHNGAAPDDPMTREAEVLERIGMPAAIGMRHATPHFAHVFAGDGYSSGYYSYMWSEVMDADAFEAFEEAGGPFDPLMAEKLETFILSVGGTAEADELYTKFRGRMPGPDALLRGRGLAEVEA